MREHWSDSDNPNKVIRGANWMAARWLIFWVAIVVLLGAGGWWLKVVTSDVRGAGDAEARINSAKNRIAAQETVQALYNDILKYDRNLDTYAATLAKNPSTFNQTNYDGQVLMCNDAVSQYNALTHKITVEKWVSPELPYTIDDNNPLTDCKESSK